MTAWSNTGQMTGKADTLLRRGEFLAAYDAAVEGLEEDPSNVALKYQAMRSLADARALEQAQAEYTQYGLDAIYDDEDVMALGARLLKEVTLEARRDRRRELARDAAEKYGEAYRRTGGDYSGINTASLLFVAGDIDEARALGQSVLDNLPAKSGEMGEAAYFTAATRAEAHLLLGNRAAAEDGLADAITRDPDNYIAHAGTLRQLAMILEAQSADAEWLNRHRPPKAAHFVGHMFELGQEGAASQEEAIRVAVIKTVESERIGVGYGAIAAGSDIVIAEAMLEASTELHLVQPCPDDVFVETSVRPYGESWVARFELCREAADVSYATADRSDFNGLDKAFSSQIAMGKAILRAQSLATEAVQIAVWDEKPARGEAGTAHDVAYWRDTGLRQVILPFRLERTHLACQPQPSRSFERKLMAMLFADTRGFGGLGDEQIPIFVEAVLGDLARCCERFETKPAHFNTWGDGLFLAFDNISDAAKAALTLQNCFRSIDLTALGLPETLALRIACHYGPVQEQTDPFLGKPNIFGNQVVVASRIEPVAVPGSIYVSEPFATVLTISEADAFRCEYVGRLKLHKSSDPVPLFSLRRGPGHHSR